MAARWPYGHRLVMPNRTATKPETGTMRQTASLNLAHDRAHRDHQAADAWRRLHAQPDVEPLAAVTATHRSIRPIVARLVAGLSARRARSTT